MDQPATPDSGVPPLRQPKPWIRGLAVLVAAAGWYVSSQLLMVSSGGVEGRFLEALCGSATPDGQPTACASVLTSPQAYVSFGPGGSGAKVPVSVFGMAYFAFVALWYLFIGPPTYRGRKWHLLFGLVVVYAAYQSLDYVRIMHYELHRWCAGCLLAHALNGGLVVLTALAWPWRRPVQLLEPHPSRRLALALGTIGVFVLAVHVLFVYALIAVNLRADCAKQLEQVINDPEYVRWDLARQPAVDIPLYDDEVFGGDPAVPHTVVVFGDFQCQHCKSLHEKLKLVADKYPGRLRVAFRHYPQDPECNPNPRFRTGGHASACRAARAVEAARLVGGREGCLALRQKLWEHQSELPDRPYTQQSEAERNLLADWAAECGLDRAAFTQALDDPAVAVRIRADVELANRLGLQAMPAVFVDGKRLRGWSRTETWDVIFGHGPSAATQPASAPATP
jgi:protein-disulfide isomerase/uncharacterized membrane protein